MGDFQFFLVLNELIFALGRFFTENTPLQVEVVEKEGSIEQTLEPTDLDEETGEKEKILESPGVPGPPPTWVNTKTVGLQVGF